MKKIGIVTIIDYYNFGNRLQNYAVCHLFNTRFNCKTITLEAYQDHPVKGNVLGWLKEQVVLQLCRIPAFANNRANPRVLRWYNFSEWSRKRIPRVRFYSCKQLPEKLNGKFDLFFSGSDQVWNYRIHNLRLNDFFLEFADDKKKNAIAASFGVDQLSSDQKIRYKNALSGFSHISVREESGARIVKDLLGKDVPVLIDPVMMLSPKEWMSVEIKPEVDIKKQYILKYYLGDDDDSIDQWAKESGYVIYELMDEKNKELYSAGPGEFLSLVRNASLVCTDSFHCIAFSILFSVPFIVFERKGKENYMVSRLETLLNRFELQNRWSYSLKKEEYLECDFRNVKEILRKEQKLVMDYLREIIPEK